MTASDHMLKPFKIFLHTRGHPYMQDWPGFHRNDGFRGRRVVDRAACNYPQQLARDFHRARVAMGGYWGTVVAAELVAAENSAGMMIMITSKFQNTDIAIMGVILIGIIGVGIDILMCTPRNYSSTGRGGPV